MAKKEYPLNIHLTFKNIELYIPKQGINSPVLYLKGIRLRPGECYIINSVLKCNMKTIHSYYPV